MILASNTFIIVLSDSTLDMSVILSGKPFVFDTPWKCFCLQHSTAILLIVVLPGSIRLDSPFKFGISWQFCQLDCPLAVVFIVIIPDNTILLYSLAVILVFLLILINLSSHFDFGTPDISFDCGTPWQLF